jgi:hypothetical protein
VAVTGSELSWSVSVPSLLISSKEEPSRTLWLGLSGGAKERLEVDSFFPDASLVIRYAKGPTSEVRSATVHSKYSPAQNGSEKANIAPYIVMVTHQPPTRAAHVMPVSV